MRWSRTLSVVDCHAEGEIGRVVVGGVGQVPGDTMFDKRVHLETRMDDIRKLILFEPRGAVWHNANIILPSNHPEAQMGYVILETTEYPVMSGSNTICVATVLLETGILPMTEPVTELTLESPAGLIRLTCACRDGKVTSVRFVNRPAFVQHLGAPVEVAGHGTLPIDVAYGGMTFAMADAASLGFAIEPSEARDLAELGQRITNAAAEQLARWSDDDLFGRLTLAVNVSPPQFKAASFVQDVFDELERTGIPANRLKLEVTESLAIDDFDASADKLRQLRASGVRISLDDFGTGNSSLNYLTKLPLSQLKIDKSFVDELPASQRDAMVAQTIIAMGRGLELDVIAEGVETRAQHDYLVAQGCHAFQGYLFGKPLPLDAFEATVRERASSQVSR